MRPFCRHIALGALVGLLAACSSSDEDASAAPPDDAPSGGVPIASPGSDDASGTPDVPNDPVAAPPVNSSPAASPVAEPVEPAPADPVDATPTAEPVGAAPDDPVDSAPTASPLEPVEPGDSVSSEPVDTTPTTGPAAPAAPTDVADTDTDTEDAPPAGDPAPVADPAPGPATVTDADADAGVTFSGTERNGCEERVLGIFVRTLSEVCSLDGPRPSRTDGGRDGRRADRADRPDRAPRRRRLDPDRLDTLRVDDGAVVAYEIFRDGQSDRHRAGSRRPCPATSVPAHRGPALLEDDHLHRLRLHALLLRGRAAAARHRATSTPSSRSTARATAPSRVRAGDVRAEHGAGGCRAPGPRVRGLLARLRRRVRRRRARHRAVGDQPVVLRSSTARGARSTTSSSSSSTRSAADFGFPYDPFRRRRRHAQHHRGGPDRRTSPELDADRRVAPDGRFATRCGASRSSQAPSARATSSRACATATSRCARGCPPGTGLLSTFFLFEPAGNQYEIDILEYLGPRAERRDAELPLPRRLPLRDQRHHRRGRANPIDVDTGFRGVAHASPTMFFEGDASISAAPSAPTRCSGSRSSWSGTSTGARSGA